MGSLQRLPGFLNTSVNTIATYISFVQHLQSQFINPKISQKLASLIHSTANPGRLLTLNLTRSPEMWTDSSAVGVVVPFWDEDGIPDADRGTDGKRMVAEIGPLMHQGGNVSHPFNWGKSICWTT